MENVNFKQFQFTLKSTFSSSRYVIIIIIMISQELLAYIVAYLIINIIYRELLVKRSECQEETDGNCRQVMMTLMSVKINISRL